MITAQKYIPPPFQIVERKGLGHPDTLADGISEAISKALSKFYLEEYGQILHYNVDKVLIIAGKCFPEFGGGSLVVPPSVVVGGRATRFIDKPLDNLVGEAAASYLQKTVAHLKDFDIEPRVGEGAPELKSLIGQGANDTSIGVGYAPLDRIERLVLGIEPAVRSVQGVGEDTKIMAVRNGRDLKIVIAVAMISRYISSRAEYDEAKAKVKDAILNLTDAKVSVNATDSGENIFLTVTGTSIEMGDDGATGRGNRGNGLITPMRPMTMEAVAGKNPVSHVGKIYNVLARKAAEDISKLDGVEEAYVTLVSKIGSPLDKPLIKGVQIFYPEGPKISPALESKAEGIVDYWLEKTGDLVEEFVKDSIPLY